MSSANGLTLDRASRSFSTGWEALRASARKHAEVQARIAAGLRPLLPSFAAVAREAVAAGKVAGCGFGDVVEQYGEQYGELDPRDVLEQARRGLRGRRALDAALVARTRSLRGLAKRPAKPQPRARRAGARTPHGRRVRTPRTSQGPPGRNTSSDDEPHEHDLIAALAAVLFARGPLPGGELAAAVRRRKTVVLEALRSDRRFARSGKTKASRWALASPVRSFNAEEAALHWEIDLETAIEFIFGAEGFLELGLVESLNGNGRVVVTELGHVLAQAMESAA